MKKLFLFCLFFVFSTSIIAHCEIPCGIYNDSMRIKMLKEDCKTIEKSMNKIKELKDGTNKNQLVRWIINKDEHATKIQKTVDKYFMTQRIKPEQKNYNKKIQLLHKMLINSMKCKQTTKIKYVNKLRENINKFKHIYFAKKDSEHSHHN